MRAYGALVLVLVAGCVVEQEAVDGGVEPPPTEGAPSACDAVGAWVLRYEVEAGPWRSPDVLHITESGVTVESFGNWCEAPHIETSATWDGCALMLHHVRGCGEHPAVENLTLTLAFEGGDTATGAGNYLDGDQESGIKATASRMSSVPACGDERSAPASRWRSGRSASDAAGRHEVVAAIEGDSLKVSWTEEGEEPSELTVRLPADLRAPPTDGEPLELWLGVDMPWWSEGAFALRRSNGALVIAAVDGSSGWLEDPELGFEGSVTPACVSAWAEEDCGALTTRLGVTLSVEGTSLAALDGQRTVTEGFALEVHQATRWEAVQCSDHPSEWVGLTVYPVE